MKFGDDTKGDPQITQITQISADFRNGSRIQEARIMDNEVRRHQGDPKIAQTPQVTKVPQSVEICVICG